MSAAPDDFYRRFEDAFRGSRETIDARLAVYQPLLDALHALDPAAPALDLGCGRGEWLARLARSGLPASGVDLDAGQVAASREAGLAVRQQCAFEALAQTPPGSLALVSAFHVVEHLPFSDFRRLLALALAALRPGGVLLLETPNPENLCVGATHFHLDPTHCTPLPPALLAFAVEAAGFGATRTLRLNQPPHLEGDAAPGLLDVLAGASPDYAVVAQRPGGSPAWQALADTLQAPGLTLAALAARHDARIEALVSTLPIMESGLTSATAALAHHQACLAALEGQLPALQAALQRATAEAAAHRAELAAVYASRSWQITAPLRWLMVRLPGSRAATAAASAVTPTRAPEPAASPKPTRTDPQ